MGAWGYGPFDSDGSLDFLGDLCDEATGQSDTGDLDPAKVNRQVVRTRLLEALDSAQAEGDYHACWDAYAAAGLIAAAAAGDTFRGEVSGTRLFESISATRDGRTPEAHQTLGLDRHCGFINLLPTDAAKDLVPAARAAVLHMLDSTWAQDFSAPPILRTQLEALANILV